MLRRLIKIAACREPFAVQVTQLRQQRQWLIDLEHLLDPARSPGQPAPTSQTVAQAVDRYLLKLQAEAATTANEKD